MSETSVHSDDLSQNGADSGAGGGGSPQVSPKVLGAALVALAALSGGLWLFFGTAWAAFCGGIFLGSLLGLIKLATKEDGWARTFMQPLAFMLVVFLYGYKGNTLMPPTWEPGAYNNGLGVFGLFTMIFASAWLGIRDEPVVATSSQSGEGAAGQADLIPEADQEQAQEPQPWRAGWRSVVAFFAVMASVVVVLSTASPHWIGTPDQAVARYLLANVYGLDGFGRSEKQHLAALLANEVAVVSKATSSDGETATVKLSLSVPVVPFEIDDKTLNSYQAERKWLALSSEQRGTSAVVDGVVRLSKSGWWGWRVVSADLKADPVEVQRLAKAGAVRVVQHVDPFRGVMAAMFGLLLGMGVLFTAFTMLMSAFMLFVQGDRAWVLACAGATFAVVGSLLPLYFVLNSGMTI